MNDLEELSRELPKLVFGGIERLDELGITGVVRFDDSDRRDRMRQGGNRTHGSMRRSSIGALAALHALRGRCERVADHAAGVTVVLDLQGDVALAFLGAIAFLVG